MTRMRAKFYVTSVTEHKDGNEIVTSETLKMSAVSDAPFDPDGVSEDSDFARWSPSGYFEIYVANPNLFGKFNIGEKYYLDFTPAK